MYNKSIIIGTDCVQSFDPKISLSDIKDISVVYKQGKKTVLVKDSQDITVDEEDNILNVNLTSTDTSKFKKTQWSWLEPNLNTCNLLLYFQVHITRTDDRIESSDVMYTEVDEFFTPEVDS